MTRDDLIATIEEAIDNVHDMGVTSRDYAVSVADALGPLLDAADEVADAVSLEWDARAAWEDTPTDRGGPHGPKGKAMAAWQARRAELHVALSTYRAAKEALQ